MNASSTDPLLSLGHTGCPDFPGTHDPPGSLPSSYTLWARPALAGDLGSRVPAPGLSRAWSTVNHVHSTVPWHPHLFPKQRDVTISTDSVLPQQSRCLLALAASWCSRGTLTLVGSVCAAQRSVFRQLRPSLGAEAVLTNACKRHSWHTSQRYGGMEHGLLPYAVHSWRQTREAGDCRHPQQACLWGQVQDLCVQLRGGRRGHTRATAQQAPVWSQPSMLSG